MSGMENAPDLVAIEAEETQASGLLRSTNAVRERSRQLLARARRGESHWLVVDDGHLPTAAHAVVTATRERYPTLAIPYHSRWRHFEAGGIDRKAQLERALGNPTPAAKARAMIDLAVLSVLLDAGAGANWRYREAGTGQTFTRSEGLGVASFHAFSTGLFSSDPQQPLRADADGLRGLAAGRLADAFQASGSNPLVGLEGRVTLLHRLGEALAAQPAIFGADGRPGGLFDALAPAPTSQVAAHDILSQLLVSLSGIWPSGSWLGKVPLGDCWRHVAVQGDHGSAGWMPFHKLSQWLTYSLLEPFAWAGVRVHGLDALTGLPEYRNGGLVLDSGLLRLRDPASAQQLWQPGDELIVEWRALTVALLDELAPLVRSPLGLSASQMPLACVLEGGTWAAGRVLAGQLRGGLPPLQVASDGTVF